MIPKWSVFTNGDGRTKYRQIVISSDSNWTYFDEIAILIGKKLNGNWTNKVDGLDERYWDLMVENVTITLHLQHYLGITLYYTDYINSEPLGVLDTAFDVLSRHIGLTSRCTGADNV
jgi:hypothetical protein